MGGASHRRKPHAAVLACPPKRKKCTHIHKYPCISIYPPPLSFSFPPHLRGPHAVVLAHQKVHRPLGELGPQLCQSVTGGWVCVCGGKSSGRVCVVCVFIFVTAYVRASVGWGGRPNETNRPTNKSPNQSIRKQGTRTPVPALAVAVELALHAAGHVVDEAADVAGPSVFGDCGGLLSLGRGMRRRKGAGCVVASVVVVAVCSSWHTVGVVMVVVISCLVARTCSRCRARWRSS